MHLGVAKGSTAVVVKAYWEIWCRAYEREWLGGSSGRWKP